MPLEEHSSAATEDPWVEECREIDPKSDPNLLEVEFLTGKCV